MEEGLREGRREREGNGEREENGNSRGMEIGGEWRRIEGGRN